MMNHNYFIVTCIRARLMIYFFVVFVVGCTTMTDKEIPTSPSLPTKVKITNFEITPKIWRVGDLVTIRFNFEGVEGGLNNAKVTLDVITERGKKTSDWERFLKEGLSKFTAESGSVEVKFRDWLPGPPRTIDAIYELKIIDIKGNPSNVATTYVTLQP